MHNDNGKRIHFVKFYYQNQQQRDYWVKTAYGIMKSYGKKTSYQNSPLPVEPIDHVILRLKLFDALIDISKFLFDWIQKTR